MVSLTYNTYDGSLSGDLAKDIVQEIQAHAAESIRPSSFRFHMAISLGGAIIILAALLCRDLSAIHLNENRPEYAESFRQALNLLRGLAVNLHAARRILGDLEDIIKVVELIQDGQSQEISRAGEVALNVDDLFPYGAVNFGQHVGFADTDSHHGDSVRLIGSTASGVDGQGTLMSWWDSWEDEWLRTAGGQGVPWI